LLLVRYIDENTLSKIPVDYDLLFICENAENHNIAGYNVIFADDSKAVFFGILSHFFYEKKNYGIAETAVVKTKTIGSNVTIGHNSFVCEEVKIGDNVRIGNNASIESPCEIGSDTFIHSGVVIGVDGYSFYETNGIKKQVPHFGKVSIGSNVVIGANTVIDRGTIDDTVIGDNSQIGVNTSISHNDRIGKNCQILCGATLCGSVYVGEGSYIAPNSTIKNGVKIGKHCMVGIGTVLKKDLPDGYIANGSSKKVMKVDYKRLMAFSMAQTFQKNN